MKIRSKTIPATLVAAGLFGFGPKSIAAEESIAELRTLIQQLDQKIKVLERKQELDKDTASEKSKTAAVVSAATAASAATSYGFGVNWHLNRNVKFSLNYELTDFDGGTSPLLENGEQALFLRAQVAF